MELVRLVHPRHFSKEKGYFKHVIFKPSSDDGGISVIDGQCALDKSQAYCRHIVTFYHERLSGNPAVFFTFEKDNLPDSHELKHEPSIPDEGFEPDECHCNIYGLDETSAKKWLIARGRYPKDMLYCAGADVYRQATVAEVMEQYDRFQESLKHIPQGTDSEQQSPP